MTPCALVTSPRAATNLAPCSDDVTYRIGIGEPGAEELPPHPAKERRTIGLERLFGPFKYDT
jgi:hypothetical protein